MNKRIFLSMLMFGSLLCGCGKQEENSSSNNGLEDAKVFKAAQIQVPFNSIMEAVRGLANPDTEAFLSPDAKSLVTEIRAKCDVQLTESIDDGTLKVAASAAKPDCTILFEEEWEKTATGQGDSIRITGRFRVTKTTSSDNTAALGGLRGFAYTGRISSLESSTGFVTDVSEALTGSLEDVNGNSINFDRSETSGYSVAGTVSQKDEDLSVRTSLNGVSARWNRNRIIKNNVITSESNFVNGKAVSQADAEKLASAKIRSL